MFLRPPPAIRMIENEAKESPGKRKWDEELIKEETETTKIERKEDAKVAHTLKWQRRFFKSS